MRTGGLLQAPVTGPVLLILNTQKRVPAEALRDTAGEVQKIAHLPCTFTAAEGTTAMADADAALIDKNNAAVVVICEQVGQPSLIVAPENRWAAVNVAALAGNGEGKEKLQERACKELWRAVGFAMGAGNSTAERCLMKPVSARADLDGLTTSTLSPEALGKVLEQAQKLGMKPIRLSTYRKAVEEGWAPAPTNEFQKAIWNELRAK
jgi:hypothetical protein